MAAQVTESQRPPESASSEEVAQLLERVFKSRHFAHAPKKQKFLQVVCDFYLSGRAHELNEYLIGREVFERDDNYNPAADPIVRVGAHDVRKRLELYYQSEGAHDELRLEIPVGSYEPIFIRRPPPTDAPGETALPAQHATASIFPADAPHIEEITGAAPHTADKTRAALWALGAAVALLAVTAAVLFFSNRNLRQQAAEARALTGPASYGPVWEPFLMSDDPTLLVLSNPPAYRFVNAGDPDVIVRGSVTLSPGQAAALGDVLRGKFIIRNTPAPRLTLTLDTYTGVGEAIGLHRLTDLFRGTGRGVLIKQSRTISAEDVKNHNLVLLGSVWANEWSGKLPVQEDFSYGGSATIENHRPRAGEEREYRSHFDEQTGELKEDYALITVKPNISSQNTVMILAGIRSAGTEAAAEFVTAKNRLQELTRRLQQAGSQGDLPRYYQALLKVGVENGIPTTISLVTVHELSPTKP
jgi:hypothetical protein